MVGTWPTWLEDSARGWRLDHDFVLTGAPGDDGAAVAASPLVVAVSSSVPLSVTLGLVRVASARRRRAAAARVMTQTTFRGVGIAVAAAALLMASCTRPTVARRRVEVRVTEPEGMITKFACSGELAFVDWSRMRAIDSRAETVAGSLTTAPPEPREDRSAALGEGAGAPKQADLLPLRAAIASRAEPVVGSPQQPRSDHDKTAAQIREKGQGHPNERASCLRAPSGSVTLVGVTAMRGKWGAAACLLDVTCD